MNGPIPEWLLLVLAATTVFTVMLSVGLGITIGEFQEEIGVVLMAISPGAPMALRNAPSAGGHRGFAPSLQIAVALLASLSMPISIAALDRLYAGSATIGPWDVAKQVCVAQLLPLGLGIAVRRARAGLATFLEPALAHAGNALLILFAVAAVIDVWGVVVAKGPRLATAVILTTAGALLVGHVLGGPDPTTRTAVATTAATRNAGLALLVATLNAASPAIKATVLAYIASSLPIVLSYLMWRRRARALRKPCPSASRWTAPFPLFRPSLRSWAHLFFFSGCSESTPLDFLSVRAVRRVPERGAIHSLPPPERGSW